MHNPKQRWLFNHIHVALDQLLPQKYQASNVKHLVFQMLFQIEISLFGAPSNDLLEHQSLFKWF